MNIVKKVGGCDGRQLARRAAVAGAAALIGTAAQATDYNESVSGDLSSDPSNPTILSTPLAVGFYQIIGSTIPSGPVVDPTGSLAVQDPDYPNFTVSDGYQLTAIDSLSSSYIGLHFWKSVMEGDALMDATGSHAATSVSATARRRFA